MWLGMAGLGKAGRGLRSVAWHDWVWQVGQGKAGFTRRGVAR